MLKDRLEQTDKALNAIVNQMRLLTNKLAQHGCIQTSDQALKHIPKTKITF